MTQLDPRTGSAATAVAPGSGSSGRRRRRKSTPFELVGMWLAAVLGALGAVVLSDAAPTDVQWIDAVQRAAVVAVLVLAGARARRWTLVLGAGLTSIFAVGVPRVGGLVALAICLYLVFADRRDRVLDSAVGALVGIAALGLQVGGPTGVETIVAIVAVVPIALSGYSYTSKRVKRRWRRGALLVVALAIVSTVLAAFASATSVTSVEDGIDATRRGVDAAATGDTAAAGAAFEEAASNFRAADARIGAWWASGARAVPVVGVNVGVVQDSVSLGSTLTSSARVVAQEVDFDAVQRLDGGVDLDVLAGFEVPIEQAATATARAAVVLDTMDSPWTVAPLSSRVNDLSSEVEDLKDQTELAAIGVQDGPAMLGAEAPRRYLVLLGNPAELRDIGGHIGNWAELVVDGGRIELVDVGGPMELAIPPEEAPESVTSQISASMAALQPERFPQNWGGDPDMATVTRVASGLFEQATGRAVDGVVYADTRAFAAFLSLSGPVDVPGLAEPFQLSSDNAEQFLTRDQFLRFERASTGDAALVEVIEEVFSRLTTTELPGPKALSALFWPLADGGNFAMSTVHEQDRRLINRLGIDRSLPDPGGGDLVSVLQRNAAPSKIDSFLSRATDVDVQWNPATGDVTSVITVELRNDAPADGLDELILGNQKGAPYGSNVSDLAVLTPFELRSVQVDGVQVGSQPQRDERSWRHTVRVVVPPGGATTVTFRLSGQVEPGPEYRLAFRGQPILGENLASVRVREASGTPTLRESSSGSADFDTTRLDGGGAYVFSWRSGNN